MFQQLARSAQEQRINLWSSDPEAQRLVAQTGLDGALKSDNTTATEVGVYLAEWELRTEQIDDGRAGRDEDCPLHGSASRRRTGPAPTSAHSDGFRYRGDDRPGLQRLFGTTAAAR
jgi:hypothetical protein